MDTQHEIQRRERQFRRAQLALMAAVEQDDERLNAQHVYYRSKAQLFYARALSCEEPQRRHWLRRAIAVERGYRSLIFDRSEDRQPSLLPGTAEGLVGFTYDRPGDGKTARIISIDADNAETHVIVECDGQQHSAHRLLIRAALSRGAA